MHANDAFMTTLRKIIRQNFVNLEQKSKNEILKTIVIS